MGQLTTRICQGPNRGSAPLRPPSRNPWLPTAPPIPMQADRFHPALLVGRKWNCSGAPLLHEDLPQLAEDGLVAEDGEVQLMGLYPEAHPGSPPVSPKWAPKTRL